MKKESIVFAVSGMFFGLILGWVIGTQQASGPSLPRQVAQQPATPATTTAPATSQGTATATVLDESRARQLAASADQRPDDAAVRVELANMYFDAERFAEAIRYYEEALRIDSGNVNASTDLGVSYYYTNQADRALAQFARSLEVDPKHTKTLLNMGIVRAFGKQDLEGAAEAWERVIALAPDSPEGRAAKQALDSMRTAHPGLGGAPTTTGGV
ncbi:MAG: tetratricopeptide repeat protein [Acidobacteria bacterium]|nr:tetratricopeptide repeat protein [Acidobacteriota bacterium]